VQPVANPLAYVQRQENSQKKAPLQIDDEDELRQTNKYYNFDQAAQKTSDNLFNKNYALEQSSLTNIKMRAP